MTDRAGHSSAAGPLLATKLFIPRARPALVARPRLVDWLEAGNRRPLTLVSAPAGFGKTTLLAEWLAAHPADQPTAWLSLDRSDDDPSLFWRYVIGALQETQPNLGDSALSLLLSPQPPPIESILTALINELSSHARDFVLVLDDYHVIENAAIHDALAFLLDHMPPGMRLVIASRSEPPLPLARLRARGAVIELQAAELRFTPAEAAAFLNDVMGLVLSAGHVTALETRTEGWIAGLQLAALSMQGREDTAGFIQTFAGDDRYIVDYLVTEVLQRQPAQVRQFLLQTSILDRLSGPLCDAVTGRKDGKAMLAALERANLFIVPLDDKRQWFRYHHLFADVLKARLLDEQPQRAPTLHLRASAWFEEHGPPADAIRHALAAADFERAAALIERAWSEMHRSYQDGRWRGWVETLPDELIRVRPVLSVGYAWALLNAGELEPVEERLADADRLLDQASDDEQHGQEAPIVEDKHEFRFLPATIASARAFYASAVGDVAAAVRHGRQAVALAPEDDHYIWGRANAILGLGYWLSGELEAAYQAFADGMAAIRGTDERQHLMTLSASYILAEIRVTQGRLRDAAMIYERSLELAIQQTARVPAEAALVHGGFSDVHREWGALEAAEWHLLRSEELDREAVYHEPNWLMIRARLKVSRGDLEGALAALNDVARVYQRSPVPSAHRVSAMSARIWILQARPADALAWASERGLSTGDELSYQREFEHVTLARALIADYRNEPDERSMRQTLEFLGRLQVAAQAGERFGSAIEILILQALAHQAQGDISAALQPLERALTLAEPEGYVQIFIDEGEPMRALLRAVVAEDGASVHVRKLLSSFDPHQSAAVATGLVEPLTPREIEILRLIAAGLKNREIADRLYISLATVKRHIANAYGKLGVSYRTEAVARARELELV